MLRPASIDDVIVVFRLDDYPISSQSSPWWYLIGPDLQRWYNDNRWRVEGAPAWTDDPGEAASDDALLRNLLQNPNANALALNGKKFELGVNGETVGTLAITAWQDNTNPSPYHDASYDNVGEAAPVSGGSGTNNDPPLAPDIDSLD